MVFEKSTPFGVDPEGARAWTPEFLKNAREACARSEKNLINRELLGRITD